MRDKDDVTPTERGAVTSDPLDRVKRWMEQNGGRTERTAVHDEHGRVTGYRLDLYVRPTRVRVIPLSHRVPAARSRECRGSRRGSRRGASARSSARSGDSGDSSDPEPPGLAPQTERHFIAGGRLA